MKTKFAAVSLLCLMMTACGGGGDDSPTSATTPESTPVPTNPEGRWIAKEGNGDLTVLNVLENGDAWGFRKVGSDFFNIDGSIGIDGQRLKANWNEMNWTARKKTLVTLPASVTPNNKLDITGSSDASLSLSYDDSYNQPADPAALVGFYAGTQYSRLEKLTVPGFSYSSQMFEAATVATISSIGELTLASNAHCSASGTILPRATGKNVYDVALTVKGDACLLKDGTSLNGIATYESEGDIVRIQASNKPGGLEAISFVAAKMK